MFRVVPFRRRIVRAALPLLLAAVASLGCIHLGPGEDETTLALRQEAEDAAVHQDWVAAWAPLRTLRVEHPEHPETADAFPLAAVVLKKLYYQHRYTAPDSAWLTSEPEFLFAWLETFYAGDGFPQEETEALLLGMPYSFAERFVAWAAGRPALARWELRVTEDNGIVESVSAEAIAPAP